MKTTRKDFNIFRDECNRLIKLYKINYIVYYEWKDIDSLARSTSDNHGMATITLAKYIYDGAEDYDRIQNLKDLAKHEIIHILICPFAGLATRRYLTSEQLESAEEKLVRHLQQLIWHVQILWYNVNTNDE